MLRAKSGWNVLRVDHDRESQREVLGDPRGWHLVIDECAHTDPLTSERHDSGERIKVSGDYLSEASRSHRVVFASQAEEHLGVRTRSPDGYYDLAFIPSDAPEAEKLADFVDAFENDFTRGQLWSQNWGSDPSPTWVDVLYRDRYNKCLIWITGRTLYIIDIPDDSIRLAAMEHLCRRSIPKIWPEVISDLFRPQRVTALETAREQVIVRRRQEVAEIDDAIDAELEFYAPFTPLTELADDQLKDLVRKAFEDVFSCTVVDLDQGLAEHEAKRLDLLVQRRGWTAFVEVRARGNRGARVEDIERLCAHAKAMENDHGVPDSKLFIFNGLYWRGLESRRDADMFSGLIVEEAETEGVCLLSTARLLDSIQARRNDEMTDDSLVGALRVPGLFNPPFPTD